jgi:hypothetical protein
MTKQTTVRLPEDLAEEAEAVARVNGTSVNALIIESLTTEIARGRADRGFTTRLSKILERDRELLDRLARCRDSSHFPSSGGSQNRSPESMRRS